MAKMDQLPVLISCSSILKPGARQDRHPGIIGERVGDGEKGQDRRADTLVSAPAVQHAWQPGSYTGNRTELHQEH